MANSGTPHTNGTSLPQTFDIPCRREPAFTPHRKLKVVTVGCGFSALIFAHKLQHQHPDFQDLVTHKIFEQREDIGGTWLVNKYPGVQCDVPAHIYVCSVSDSEAGRNSEINISRLFHSTPNLTGATSMRPERTFKHISKRQLRSGILIETCT